VKSHWHHLIDPVYQDNQVLVAILGLCSALGVTGRLSVALTMGFSVTFVIACSAFFVSLLRREIPESVRVMVQLTIISLFVITVDQFLRAYFFAISKVMSVFVGLIITNCIVMGRTEGMSRRLSPIPAFLDGVGAGLGYTWVLAVIGGVRELFGFGTLLGYPIIPLAWYATADFPDGYRNNALMTLPASAFFLIGFLIFGMKQFQQWKGRRSV